LRGRWYNILKPVLKEEFMKVGDLSKEELKALIGEVIEEKFRELFDPDYGLELREDFVQALETSIASKERIPFEDVKKRLGLS
jgi:hypothetical protein